MGEKFFIMPDLYYEDIVHLSDEDAGKLLKGLYELQKTHELKVEDGLKPIYNNFVAFYLVLATEFKFSLRKRK